MTAPTVVYQNKIPHRNNQLASGRKKGKETKPISPKIKPMPLPMAIRVMSDGLLNIEVPPFAAVIQNREGNRGHHHKQRSERHINHFIHHRFFHVSTPSFLDTT
jgi:hypothetical protein